MMGRLFVVGVSPLYVPKLPRADMLVGAERHLSLYPDFTGEWMTLKPPFEPIFDRVEEVLKRGNVVILATGDPLFYGIAQRVVERFGSSLVEVIPNLSYMQLAFARVGVSWENAGFFSLHGRNWRGFWRALALSPRHLFLFTDRQNSPKAVAKRLLEGGVEGVHLWVFCRLGEEDENVYSLSVEEAASLEFGDPNCMVIEKVRDTDLHPFLPDGSFLTSRGLLTKAPLRALVLSLLEPRPDHVVWDVGSGSGAVAISLSPLVEEVYAVEKRPEHLSILRANRAKHGAWNVLPVAGEAPEVCKELPDPNRVFVGAGGERLGEILESCWERLSPGGILVATVVTLRGRREILEWGRGDLLAINTAWSRLNSKPDFLEPSRPVWVLRAEK